VALFGAIQQALGAYEDRPSWQFRMRRGMSKDFSWDISATHYQDLYR